MKKTLLVLAITITSYCSYAQTNIFPSSGNVGIGTISPLGPLDVKLSTNQHIQFVPNLNGGYPGISGIVCINDANSGYTPLGLWATSYFFGNGNVGIGNTSPAYKLDVNGVVNSNNDIISTNGTIKAFLSTSNSYTTGVVGTQTAHDFAIYTNSLPVARFTVAGNLGIGTLDTKGYKLAVNGNVIATSMTVKLYADWPDYVFKRAYKLPSLSEVKTYIDKNHRLPEMPSEQEVKDNGINLGELNKILVKKVEELTLYLIKENKQNHEQQNKLEQQEVRISALEAALSNLTASK